MLNDRARQISNIVLAVGQIIIGSIAEVGEVSALYPNYIIPADYAFSIWSLIFLLAMAYAVYQLLPSQSENPLFRAVGWFSAGAFFFNCLWMLVFSRGHIWLSVLIIFGILASLAFLMTALYKFKNPLTDWEKRLIYPAFSIFSGWITVATVANVTVALVASGWNGFGIPAMWWGAAMLLAITALASTFIYLLRGNLPYGLTVIWALTGIFVNQYFGLVKTASTTIAAVAALMILTIAAVVFFSRQPQIKKFSG